MTTKGTDRTGLPGHGEAYDPADVRIRPAATVMLVRDNPTLEVLMLRRTARTIFAGDMWVYPGGAVDLEDATHLTPFCQGLSDDAATGRLGISDGGIGYWVAAVRECFEEAGVLFSPDANVLTPERASRLAVHRDDLNNRRSTFAEVIEGEGLRLDLGGMHYVAHWRTPLGPPRRFDTRFFLAAMPDGQTPSHDDSEAVHHEWIRPSAGVALWRNDEMAMMTPTARMLMCLAEFERAEDVIAAAAQLHPFDQVRVRHLDDGTYDVLLPHDTGWDDGDPDTEFGYVGLRPAPT